MILRFQSMVMYFPETITLKDLRIDFQEGMTKV